MSRLQEKQLLCGLNYPLFKLTTSWQSFRFFDEFYVCYSRLRGYTPCVDIKLVGGGMATMLINQTSLGLAIHNVLERIHGSEASLSDEWFRPYWQVRRADQGKYSTIEFSISPSQPADNDDGDEDE